MSDQPKPMTGGDATLHTQNQRMSDAAPTVQPAGAAGERTAEQLQLRRAEGGGGYIGTIPKCNDALDEVIADDAEIIVELEAELAAERRLRQQVEAKLHDWVYGNQQTQWLRDKAERLAEAMRTIAGMHHLPADVVAQSALAKYAIPQPDFHDTYELLAQEGKCDLPDGVEYERVFREWCDQGCPSNVEAFIIIRANGKSES